MTNTPFTQSLQLCSRVLLSLVVLITAGTQTANAQIAKYAAIINDPNNYGWYVPDRYFLTYASSSDSFAKPAPVGDQTLWTNMRADPTTGVFTGRTVAVLAVGSGFTPPSPQTMLGVVDDQGHILIRFTPVGGDTSTLGVGQFQTYGTSSQMEMQMISGTSTYVTHWAYMTPYPASYTPSAPITIPVSNASPQWAWSSGTPWKIVSPTLFGNLKSGRFIISAYNAGYFIGQGVDSTGSASFTALGSVTPEGKVLFNTITDDTAALESFYGTLTGDALAASMRLGPYGNSSDIATLSLVAPYSQKLEAAPAAIGAADALYNIARSATGLSSQWVPILNNLESFNGTSFSSAVSQTLPVLVGASSLATAQIQSQINQITRLRQDHLSQATPNQSSARDQPIWGKAFGNWGSQGGLNDVSGYNTYTGGLAFGFDKALFPNAHVGLSIGFAQSQITSQSATAPSNLDMSNYQASLYGLYSPTPDWQWVYQVGAAMNNNRSSRTLSRFSEVGNIGNATAQFNSYVGFAGLGLQKRITMASTTTLTPEIRLDYISVQTEGYTETGAGNLNLKVSSQTFDTLYTTLGVRVDHALDERLTLSANVGVSYNALDTQAQLVSTFTGGGSAFTTHGLAVSPWLFNAGAGVHGFAHKNVRVGLSYNLSLSNSQYINQMLNAELQVLF
jgi:outer membrane autotransporter protein